MADAPDAAPSRTEPLLAGVFRFAMSAVGAKVVMALTGLGLGGFIVAHMAGNLAMCGGPDGDPYAAELKRQASPDIVFAGALPAALVRTLYANAALFVHPSHMEGFALVVLEAIAADAPLLVSRIAPHLELSLDPGCYFEAGSVEELSERLATGDFERLRPARRTEILAEGSWDRIAERHHAILINRDRPRPRKPRARVEQEVSIHAP